MSTESESHSGALRINQLLAALTAGTLPDVVDDHVNGHPHQQLFPIQSYSPTIFFIWLNAACIVSLER